jgi:poly(A) polymerase
MELLQIGPSELVGQAYDFLLDQRINHGPVGAERAKELLLEWHQQRQAGQSD